MTSDKYFSLVDGFIYFFKKNSYFNFCEVFFACETITLNDFDQFHFIKTKDSSWSKRLHKVLNQITHKNVFLLLEDFYFLKRVNFDAMETLVNQFVESNFDSIIMNPNNLNSIKSSEFGTSQITLTLLEKSSFQSKYFISTGTFFKTSSLKGILRKNENPWEFEVMGSFRAKISKKYSIGCFDGFKNFNFGFPSTGVIARGKLIEKYKEDIEEQGFSLLWEDIDLDIVTTINTPLIIRLLRIPPRYIKMYLNIYLNKL